jgi:hypothetical protein
VVNPYYDVCSPSHAAESRGVTVSDDDEKALLIAMPLRHLESAVAAGAEAVVLPAGGPGDLDAVAAGMEVVVIVTHAGEDEVPAATWHATFVRRVPYEPEEPWPAGLPATWVAEHPIADPVDVEAPARDGEADEDDEDDEDDEYEDDDYDEQDDDDAVGPQSFLEVTHLRALPRHSWLFTNELVRKQARGGRSFRPRVPTIVNLPD